MKPRSLVPVGPGTSTAHETDPAWRQSAATKRAIYRRLALDPDYLPQVPWRLPAPKRRED